LALGVGCPSELEVDNKDCRKESGNIRIGRGQEG